MLCHGLRSAQAVIQLPGPLELVQILGAEVLEILLHDIQQLDTSREQLVVGHVIDADATDVLVHGFLETLQALDGQQVAGRNGTADDLIAAYLVVFQRLVDGFLEIVDLLVGHLDLLAAQVPDVFHCSLGCEDGPR